MRNKDRVPVFIRIGLIVLSWGTLFFLPKGAMRKYLPVGTFSALLVVVLSVLDIPFKWWKVAGGIKTRIFNDFSFIFGPYFIGTVWIFQLTFGKFGLYALTNAVLDALLSFPISRLLQKLKVFKLVNIKPVQLFYTTFGFALALYVYQLFISHPKSSE